MKSYLNWTSKEGSSLGGSLGPDRDLNLTKGLDDITFNENGRLIVIQKMENQLENEVDGIFKNEVEI